MKPTSVTVNTRQSWALSNTANTIREIQLHCVPFSQALCLKTNELVSPWRNTQEGRARVREETAGFFTVFGLDGHFSRNLQCLEEVHSGSRWEKADPDSKRHVGSPQTTTT